MKETEEYNGTIRAQERANQHPINADLTVSESPRGSLIDRIRGAGQRVKLTRGDNELDRKVRCDEYRIVVSASERDHLVRCLSSHDEMTKSLGDALRMLEAVRYTSGLSNKQMDRVRAARAVLERSARRSGDRISGSADSAGCLNQKAT